MDAVRELRSLGSGYLVPAAAPVYGLGHSNGALLLLLISAFEPCATDGNIVISFNNLCVPLCCSNRHLHLVHAQLTACVWPLLYV